MEKKINVCFFLISGGWGGAENVVYHLAKSMQKKVYDISIILNEETYPYFKELKNVKLYNIGPIFSIRNILQENFHISIPKHFQKRTKFTHVIKIFFNLFLLKLNYTKIRQNVIKTINEIHPDIIHFHNSIVLQFCPYILPYLNYSMIYTSHGIDFEENYIPTLFFKDRKKRRVLKNFTVITTVSQYLKQNLLLNKVNSDIQIIHNGIDLNNIQDILNTISNKIDHSKFTILFPGGQKKQKGGEILLQAFKNVKKKHDNIKLYYCGYVTSEFKKQNQDNDVIFTDLLPHNEYLTLLASCDCLTLLSETEGFPITILEAMGLGKTIITTSVGGIPEIVTNGINGFFVERDPERVAEKIILLLNNVELRNQISKNNLQDVIKFQWDIIADQYTQLYKSIIL